MAKSFGKAVIGEHLFDTDSLELRDPDGTLVPLRAQSALVLRELVLHEGELVTKSDMMERVWPDTFVTDDSLVKCISDIRKSLAEDGHLLHTVPKRGYRLDSDAPDEAQQPNINRPGTKLTRRAAALAAVVITAAVLIWALAPKPEPATPEHTLAVLPFRNASEDPDHLYLANGVAEDLIVALSQLSDLRVVSQGASFTYSSESTDIRSIAKSLDANIVLDGSVRRVGNDLRLTIALVNGATGENLWAKQYDGDRSELLSFQSDVLNELVRTLSVRLSQAERGRLGVRGTTDVDAHDAYLKGRALENLYTRATNLEAEKILQTAVSRDPGFALAHAHLSQIYSFRLEYEWVEDRGATIELAFQSAQRAIELDPELPFAHFALGRLYTRNFAQDLPDATQKSFQEFEKAIKLDPNYVDAYVFLAMAYMLSGDAQKAMPLIDAAVERNPLPPYWYALAKGIALYFLGEFSAAEPFLIAARDQNPSAPQAHRYLVATYGMLGQLDDAEWTLFEYEGLGHDATVNSMLSTGSIKDKGYREQLAKGLRAANVPEG